MIVKLAKILLKLTKLLKDAQWHDAGDEAELNRLIEEMEVFIQDHE